MSRPVASCFALVVALGSGWLPLAALADDPPKAPAAPTPATPAPAAPATGEKYELKYQFKPGEALRWKVEHRAKVRTTISGTTQTAETESFSEKVWRVKAVDAQGVVTFQHSVDIVQMRQKLTGRQEETYDSSKDTVPPAAFQDVAKNVGVPLSEIKMDALGKVLHRENFRPQPTDGQLTIPLPAEPVPVGHTWSVPLELDIKLDSGVVKKIKTRQQYKLEDVKTGVAKISLETVILSPVRDPVIEAQLIQRETSGSIRFDIDAGRVLSQQMDLNKQVNGFRGETSLMHYETRFSETLLPASAKVARPSKPAGPPAFKR